MGRFEKRMSCWDGLKVGCVWIHKRRKPQEAQARVSTVVQWLDCEKY